MRFIDEASIRVFGGHGGPGCVSFRRETFIPRGGPDGGDGGEGGAVIFIASDQLSTLQDFRFKREYRAPNGIHGSGTNKAGKDGLDITVRIPVGTVVKDAETGEILVDFTKDKQEWVAAKGGRGGKGNAHFVSSTFQAPKFAQPGEDGTSREVKLELKLIADVGIIGFPNAGKSTLISRISAARPKVADYPFTTLTPNLGVVHQGDLPPFVVADIPGLVEGAHRGVGLGHKFLKHIERTRLFVHLLDGTKFLEDVTSEPAETSPQASIEKLLERYDTIRRELGLFNGALLHKPELVVINKGDLFESDPELMERVCLALKERIRETRGSSPELAQPLPGEPLLISAATSAGVPALITHISDQLREIKQGMKTKDTLLPDREEIRA